MQRSLDAEVAELETDYQKQMSRMKHYYDKFLNKINLEEADHEREIVLYTQALRAEIEREKEGGAKYVAENEVLTGQNNAEISEIYKKQKEVEDLIVENTNLMEEKVKYSLSILKMQEQLLEREKVIINKECDLKTTVDVQKSLENFRYILDRKISNFIAEKNRVMDKIREKEEAIRRVFAELAQQNELNGIVSRSSALQHNLLIMFIGHEKHKMQQIRHLALKFQIFAEKVTTAAAKDVSLTQKKVQVKELIAEFDRNRFESLDNSPLDVANDKDNKVNGYTGCIEENSRIKEDILNLLKKVEVSHKASKNQVLMEVAKTKNLIEECNKLRQENDYYQKLLQEMTNAVQQARVSRIKPPLSQIQQNLI